MFGQSITCAVIDLVRNSAANSAAYRLILRLVSYFRAMFAVSITRNWVAESYGLDRSYHTSVFYYIINKIITVLIGGAKRVYSLAKKWSDGGFIRSGYDALHSTGYFRYEYLLAAFFALMMIVPHDYWNNIYAVAGALLFALVYFVICPSGKKLGTDFRAVPVSLIAFFVAIVGAVLISPVPADAVRIALFFIASIVFALLISGSISDEKTLKIFVSVIIGALFVMCLYAIYQNFVGVPVDILLTDVNTNENMPGRVYSTFENPNNFAEAIVLILPFVYAMFICADGKKKKGVFAGVFVICMAALAMSYSRSCYVAFAISTFVFALLYDWRLLLPLGLLVLVCVPFMPETVMNRILTIGSMEDTSNAYRVYLWDGVLKMLRSVGLGGVGIGPEAFAEVYPEFASPLAAKAPHSHMLYLELLIEIGIVGVTGFLAYMGSTLKKGFASIGSASKFARVMIIAAISSFAGISFTACAEYIWFYPRVMFVFWIVVGILLAAVRCVRKKA